MIQRIIRYQTVFFSPQSHDEGSFLNTAIDPNLYNLEDDTMVDEGHAYVPSSYLRVYR